MKLPWWQWLPIFGWRIVGVVEAADEIPDRLPRNGAVLVGLPHLPKWVAFDCPCRWGHRIMLNTDRQRQPVWTTTTAKKLTLAPSVDYQGRDRRCHYVIRNGRAKWV